MKDLFSSLKTRLQGGGGHKAFNLQEKLYREEELLNNCNFDSLYKNDLQGGDLYLSTVTSAENLIGGASYASLEEAVQPYVQILTSLERRCRLFSLFLFYKGGVC